MRLRIAVLAAVLISGGAAYGDRQIVGAQQDHALSNGAAVSCEDSFNNTYTIQPMRVGDQTRHEIDLESATLDIRAVNHGGVVVRGWDEPHVKMVVCRFAAANSLDVAHELVEQIVVTSERGLIRATGPAINETQTWWVNMTLFVPRRTNLTVRAESGGVAIRDMRARVQASSVSGGISIARSNGRHTVRTESGGITLDRVRGSVDANSKDGSIAFKLAAGEEASLEATTAESGQILCVLERCNDPLDALTRTSLRLGRSSPRVRLVTGTGSIHISSVKS